MMFKASVVVIYNPQDRTLGYIQNFFLIVTNLSHQSRIMTELCIRYRIRADYLLCIDS